MDIDPRIARWLFRSSTDESLVVELADRLISHEWEISDPGVPFPAVWAKARQRNKAHIAAEAIKYCADAELQLEVFFSTKRLSVRTAIAESPYLTEENRAAMFEWAKANSPDKLAPLLGPDRSPDISVRVSALSDGLKAASTINLYAMNALPIDLEVTMLDLVGHADFDAETADSIIEMAAAARCDAILGYALVNQLMRDDGFAKSSFSSMQLIDLIAEDNVPWAVRAIMVECMYTARLARRIGLDLARLLVIHGNPAFIGASVYKDSSFDWFTQEAREYLLEEGSWGILGWAGYCDDELFELWLGRVGLAGVVRAISAARLNRLRVELILDRLEELDAQGIHQSDFWYLVDALDADDPLVRRVVRISDSDVVLCYLCGKFDDPDYSVRRAPRKGDIAYLLPSIKVVSGAGLPRVIDTRGLLSLGDDYWQELILVVPMVAHSILSGHTEFGIVPREMADFIARAIEGSANPLVCCEQITAHPELSLAEAIDVTRALEGA